MLEAAGGSSVHQALLQAAATDEEAPLTLSDSSHIAGRPALHNWTRTAAAVEHETGLHHIHAHQQLNSLQRTFVTKIVTVVNGQLHSWHARQHRRNRAQWQQVAAKPHLHRCAVFDAGRIRAATSNPVKRVSFWAGPLFFMGAALLFVGTAVGMSLRFGVSEWAPDRQLACADGPFLVGAVALLLGCYASFIEAANVDVSDAWDDWEASGRKQPPPRVWYAPWPPSLDSPQLGFYGLLIQYLGSIIFLLGCGTAVVADFHPITHPGVLWPIGFLRLLGAVLLAVGAVLLAAEGSHSWWRGLLPPLRLKDARSVNHWAEHLNWVGSLLFVLGAAAQWLLEGRLTVIEEAMQAACTWLLGSAVLAARGTLLHLETVNPAW